MIDKITFDKDIYIGYRSFVQDEKEQRQVRLGHEILSIDMKRWVVEQLNPQEVCIPYKDLEGVRDFLNMVLEKKKEKEFKGD